jgi:hypothetical protein
MAPEPKVLQPGEAIYSSIFLSWRNLGVRLQALLALPRLPAAPDGHGDSSAAADSLGHIAVAEKTMLLADVMAAEGDTSARADLLNGSADTLARRGVLPGVVEALRQQ